MKKLITLTSLFAAAVLSAGTLEIAGDKLGAGVDGKEVKISQLRDIKCENGALVFGPKAYGIIPFASAMKEYTLTFDIKINALPPVEEGAKRRTNSVFAFNSDKATCCSFCYNQYPKTDKVLVNFTQCLGSGKYAISQKSNVALKVGQVYRFSVVRDASSLTLSLDGKVLHKVDIKDEALIPMTKMRLGISGSTPAPSIEFSNFKLTAN